MRKKRSTPIQDAKDKALENLLAFLDEQGIPPNSDIMDSIRAVLSYRTVSLADIDCFRLAFRKLAGDL